MSNTVDATRIQPLPYRVIVTNLERGQKVTHGGIIVPDDDAQDRGIRPRWAQVYRVGKDIEDLYEGQWILIEHGRWTRTINADYNGEEIRINMVDYPDYVLAVADEKPHEAQEEVSVF